VDHYLQFFKITWMNFNEPENTPKHPFDPDKRRKRGDLKIGYRTYEERFRATADIA
jgi:hypothetical protein